MPDDLPDLGKPWPDLGHEAIRQAIVQHDAEIADHLEQLSDAFLVGQTAADALGIALTNFVAVQQALAALTARVAALEAAPPAPDPATTPNPPASS